MPPPLWHVRKRVCQISDLDLSQRLWRTGSSKLCRQMLQNRCIADEEELLESRYIHCDESRIQVLGEPVERTTQNWMVSHR